MTELLASSSPLPKWDVEDLVKWTMGSVQFHQAVHAHSCLHSRRMISRAIHRYEAFWLPLAFRKQDTTLVPPMDVAWVWQAHMSAPKEYEQDCLATVSAIVDHCPPIGEKQMSKGVERARAIWNQWYRDEPYDFQCCCGAPPAEEGEAEPARPSAFSYDLHAAVARQHSRTFQTLLPHFRDPKFMRMAVQRYLQHITLCKEYPTIFLVPTYDITVVWGAHLCRPLRYRSDMDMFAGRILDRDDLACGDHRPGSLLDVSLATTSRLWTDHGWRYHTPGTGYRGDRPLLEPSPQEFAVFSVTEYTLTISFIVFTSLPPNQKFVVRTFLHDAQEPCLQNHSVAPRNRDRKLKYEFQSDQTGRSSILSAEMLGEAAVGRVDGQRRFITLVLSEPGMMGWTVGTILLLKSFDLQALFGQANEAMVGGRTEPFVEQMEATCDGFGVVLEISLRPERTQYNLDMEAPQFSDLPHPAAGLKLAACLLPTPYRFLGAAPCRLATAVVRGSNPGWQKPLLRTRVVRGDGYAAIEVQNHATGVLLATAQSLDARVLPYADQVEDLSATCTLRLPTECEAEQRAMLIRDTYDWGVLLGSWWHRPQDRAGSLQLAFFSLRERRWDPCQQVAPGQFEILGQRFTLHAPTLRLAATCADVAQLVCLAAAIEVLSTLCGPPAPPPEPPVQFCHLQPPPVVYPPFEAPLQEWASRYYALLLDLEAELGSLLPAPDVIRNAIRRYELCWLPLARERQDVSLAAPPDVALVWHAHMLSPRNYERDCIAVVGGIVDHRLLTAEERAIGRERAWLLWKVRCPWEPFDPDFTQPFTPYASRLRYDLAQAVYRHADALVQVRCRHFREPAFLEESTQRYTRHLALTVRYPDALVLPTVDVDFLWRAHQLHPLLYRSDMDEFVGHLLHPNYSCGEDCRGGNKLQVFGNVTRQLWADHGWLWAEDGVLGRTPHRTPNAPPGNYHAFAIRSYDVRFVALSFTNLPARSYTLHVTCDHQRVLTTTVSGPDGSVIDDEKPGEPFAATASQHRLTFTLLDRSLLGPGQVYFEHTVDLTAILASAAESFEDWDHPKPFQCKHAFHSDQGCGLRVEMDVLPATSPGQTCYAFELATELHSTVARSVAEQLKSGPSLLPVIYQPLQEEAAVLVEGQIEGANVGTQRPAFSFRAVLARGFLAAEVLDCVSGEVVATAETTDTLALPSPQRSGCSLEPHAGEHAMLIRGQRDWAVCAMRWQPPGRKKRTPSVTPDQGNALTRFWLICEDAALESVETFPQVQVGGVQVDLATGRLECGGAVPEAVALALALQLLQLRSFPAAAQAGPLMQAVRQTPAPRSHSFALDTVSMGLSLCSSFGASPLAAAAEGGPGLPILTSSAWGRGAAAPPPPPLREAGSSAGVLGRGLPIPALSPYPSATPVSGRGSSGKPSPMFVDPSPAVSLTPLPHHDPSPTVLDHPYRMPPPPPLVSATPSPPVGVPGPLSAGTPIIPASAPASLPAVHPIALETPVSVPCIIATPTSNAMADQPFPLSASAPTELSAIPTSVLGPSRCPPPRRAASEEVIGCAAGHGCSPEEEDGVLKAVPSSLPTPPCTPITPDTTASSRLMSQEDASSQPPQPSPAVPPAPLPRPTGAEPTTPNSNLHARQPDVPLQAANGVVPETASRIERPPAAKAPPPPP
eukprot:EG_transcript_265